MNHMQKMNPLGQGLSIFTKKKLLDIRMNLMNFDQLHECGKIKNHHVKTTLDSHTGGGDQIARF